MAVSQNIESYVRWRGDVGFAEGPFTAVDNLVLSKLAYYDFSVVPEVAGDEGLTLRACWERMGPGICLKGLGERQEPFFVTCAQSRRFGTVRIRHYEDVYEAGQGVQFCAMEFLLTDDLSYLAFRGTDNTLVGWREDFDISYRSVPSQRMALAFLYKNLREGRRYLVGGHSKGANLALYATVRLDERRWNRVEHVYLNDGPGLRGCVAGAAYPDGYRRRVTRILPAHSVFGRLFEPVELRKVIVSTSASGLLAHELLSWEVADGGLCRADAHDASSEHVAEAFSRWMEHAAPKDCAVFVEELFRALEASGVTRTTELGSCGRDGFEEVLRSLAGSKGAAKVTFAHLPLGILFGDGLRRARKSGFLMWVLRDDLAHNLCLLVLGFLFVVARGTTLYALTGLVLFAVTGAFVAETLTRLRSVRWDVTGEWWRVNVSLCMVVLLLTSLAREEALFVYGSTVFGVVLIAMALFYGGRLDQRSGLWRTSELVIAILLGLSALYLLMAPAEALGTFASSLGALLLAAGCIGIADLASGV